MKQLLLPVLITLASVLGAQTVPDKDTTRHGPEIFTLVEQMPEFPGGQKALGEYFSKNIKYPKKARKQNIEGKVFVKFVVDETGKIGDAYVVKSIANCPDCDKEALKAVMKMPRWKPGMQGGKPVKVYYMLPLNFKIRDKK